MPVMDGFEVLDKIKNNPGIAAIPTVMLTALDDDLSKSKASEFYSEQYISKPVDVVNLRLKIEEILGRGRV